MTPGGTIYLSNFNDELQRTWNQYISMNDWNARCLMLTRDGGTTYMSNGRSRAFTPMWVVAGNPPDGTPGYYTNNFGPSMTGWDNGDYNTGYGSSNNHWFRGNRVFRVMMDKSYARIFVDIFGNIPQGNMQYMHVYDGNGNLVYNRKASELNWYEYVPNGYGYTRFGWDWGGFGFTVGWGYTVHLYG